MSNITNHYNITNINSNNSQLPRDWNVFLIILFVILGIVVTVLIIAHIDPKLATQLVSLLSRIITHN